MDKKKFKVINNNIESYKEELYQKYKNHPDVLKLDCDAKIIKKGIFDIKRAIESNEICDNDLESLDCKINNYHSNIEINITNTISISLSPCLKAINNPDNILKKYIKFSNINAKKYGDFFEKGNIFDQDDPARQRIINKLINIKKLKDTNGFFLSGTFGSGKTYFLSSLLNSLAKQEKTVAIVNLTELFDYLKASISKRDVNSDYNINQIQENLKTVDYLVLDGMGNESFGKWTHLTVLLSILQHRLDYDKTTIFSSDMKIDELKKYYLTSSFSRYGESGALKTLIDRIKTLSFDDYFQMSNKDYRLNKKTYS